MRIALMTNNYKPFMGGVPISIERLADGLRSLGHSVTVFAPAYREQQEETDVIRYATLTQHFVGGIVLPNPFDLRIEREFRKQQFDLIHVHHPMLIGRTAVYLSKKYNIPLVFTYHTRYEQYLSYVKAIAVMEQCAAQGNGTVADISEDCLYLIKDRIMPLYLNTFLKHCDFVFAPTEGIKEYLKQVCGISANRLGVLPTGLQGEQFLASAQEKRSLRQKYGAENQTLFLTVARMSHEKNIHFLIQSLAKLKQRCRKDFKMLFVGDGPDRKEYEEMCRQLGLADHVTFTGTVPNSETGVYFGAADAFLFASKTETQGIVVLEAFAGETPVLAVEASGVSDLVQSGYNGILTREDTDLYSEVLARFLEGGYDRLTLSQNALETALEYREEAVAMQAVNYYNTIRQHVSAVKRQNERENGKQVSYFSG